MRKFYYLWLLALFTCWQLDGQVTIGTGTATGQGLPVEPYFGYSYSQVIYLQSEVGAAMNIGQLTYTATSATTLANSGEWTIYIGHTTKTSFADTSDWIAVADMTEVYSGPVTISGGQVDIVLNTAFSYNGMDNLVIAVHESESGWDMSSHDFYNTAVPDARGIVYRNDTTNPDPASPPLASTSTYLRSYIANVTLAETPSCLPVTNLYTSNVTTSSVDINWTSDASVTNWEYVVQAVGGGEPTSGTATSSNPINVNTGIDPGTSYEVWVRSDCGGGDYSLWAGPYVFTTACSSYTATYMQNFDGEMPPEINACWTKLLENSTSTSSRIVNKASTSTLPAFSEPNFIEFYNSGDTSGTYLLVSPQFTDFGADKRVRVQVRMNTYSATEGDVIEIGTMSDPSDSSTYTMFQSFAQADFTEDAWVEKIVNFTGYTGTDQYVAIKWTPGATYNYWYFDNFVYELSPSCAEPTALSGDVADGTSADFTWTAGGSETEWEWAIVTSGDPAPTSGTTVASEMATATNLVPGTTYDFYVRANCGTDNNSIWVMTTLIFDYCSSEPTSNDGSGITNVNFQGTDYAVEDVTYYDNTATVTDVTQGQMAQMTITFATGYTYGTNIWIDFNDNLLFEASELVYQGVSTSSNPTDLDASFVVPAGAALGQHRMRIGTADSGQATPNPCYSGSYGVTVDWMVNVVEPPMIAVDNGFVSALVVTGSTTVVTSIETCQSLDVLVQANEPGVTDADAAAAGANLLAWVAYSSDNTDPSTWADALWMPATYTQDVGSNDEFSLSIDGLAAGTYYIASRFQLDGGVFVYGGNGGIYDGTTYNNAEIMVVDPMAVTASSDVMEVCMGDSANLTAASDDTTYTYEWDNEAGTGAMVTVTPTETTTYTVTGTNGVGCMVTSSVTVVVNPLPSALTVTPSPAAVCEGADPVELMVEGGTYPNMVTEGFETAPPAGWSFYQSEADDPGFVQTDDRAHSGTYSYYHNDDNIAVDSDAWMMTPGYAATAGSSFDFWYNQNYTASYYNYSGVWVSTTGTDPVGNPSDWTELQELTGSEDTWTEVSLDLSSYAGQTVYLAFKYTGDYNHELYIDDCTFTSQVTGTLAWSPSTGLYTDAAGTTAYAGENLATVYAMPTAATTYSVTSTTPSGCESTMDVEVTVSPATPAPGADATQIFCSADMPTLADLVVTGDNIVWYDADSDGNMLADTDALVDGTTYYASATSDGLCESITRTPVMVVVNVSPEAPTADAAQTFCSADMPTVADLVATGDNVTWYDAVIDGMMMDMTSELTDGTSYFAQSTSADGCMSTRTEVMVTINTTPDAPTADLIQEFCPDDMPTIGDLVASGNEVVWYDAATGGNILSATDLLADGTAYYAQDIGVGGCVSATRTTVVVDFDDSLCPSNNDDCADAEAITVNDPAESGNTSNTSDEMSTTCSDTMTDGVWYTVVGDGADLTVTVSPNGWDSQIAVLEGDCTGGFTCNGGADEAGTSGTESYTFPSTAGTTYYVLVGTNETLSEGEFAIQVTTNLGITDIENVDSSITIYPNPVSDILNINVDQGIEVLQIFGSNGSLVKETTAVSDNSINVHTLQSGTYVLRVILDDHTVVTEKFIKR